MRSATILLFALFMCAADVRGSSDSCFALRVARRDASDTLVLNEGFHSKGLLLLIDGVYNFRVRGKDYPMHRILEITRDSIRIGFCTDSLATISFAPSEIDHLLFYSLDNGVTGFPHIRLKPSKFAFEIIEHSAPCSIPRSKVCSDRDCLVSVDGYHYLTAGY